MAGRRGMLSLRLNMGSLPLGGLPPLVEGKHMAMSLSSRAFTDPPLSPRGVRNTGLRGEANLSGCRTEGLNALGWYTVSKGSGLGLPRSPFRGMPSTGLLDMGCQVGVLWVPRGVGREWTRLKNNCLAWVENFCSEEPRLPESDPPAGRRLKL